MRDQWGMRCKRVLRGEEQPDKDVDKDFVARVFAGEAMLVAVVLGVARVDARGVDGALFGVRIARSVVGMLHVVLDVILVALVGDVGLVDGGVVGKDDLVRAASQGSAAVVEMHVLMLVRIVQSQVWVLVDTLLGGDVMTVVGEVMVLESALADFTMAVDRVRGFVVGDDFLRRSRLGCEVVVLGGHCESGPLLVPVVEILGQDGGPKKGQGNEEDGDKRNESDQPGRHGGGGSLVL